MVLVVETLADAGWLRAQARAGGAGGAGAAGEWAARTVAHAPTFVCRFAARPPRAG
jgi:hypothetical protein